MVDLERIKAESVAYFRALDEGAALRHHFRHADEEGGLWYIEAVPDRGELTDQAIDPKEEPLEAIPAEEFQRVWTL
ncbi:hypothetical protein A6P39_026915 [Streptomyces sp. FXJ1.172]|uniref:hypothetical protein n=1 Tax=Streptomyces sp. FXJ1.172 TaxID=710705 RepID=UPI0007D00C18|nr:hypothetical protein [Streptomyces sp. FXJ1.172]WEO97356.1 hypothetical protein A6P39_026915 [Streptomyces sp. FXJ1.172]